MDYTLYIRRVSSESCGQVVCDTVQPQANMAFACAVSQSEISECPTDQMSHIRPTWWVVLFSRLMGRKIVEYPRAGIYRRS